MTGRPSQLKPRPCTRSLVRSYPCDERTQPWPAAPRNTRHHQCLQMLGHTASGTGAQVHSIFHVPPASRGARRHSARLALVTCNCANARDAGVERQQHDALLGFHFDRDDPVRRRPQGPRSRDTQPCRANSSSRSMTDGNHEDWCEKYSEQVRFKRYQEPDVTHPIRYLEEIKPRRNGSMSRPVVAIFVGLTPHGHRTVKS
jgi:hypothetical protein